MFVLSLKDALSCNWEMPTSPPLMHTPNWWGAQPSVGFPHSIWIQCSHTSTPDTMKRHYLHLYNCLVSTSTHNITITPKHMAAIGNHQLEFMQCAIVQLRIWITVLFILGTEHSTGC